MTLRVSVDGRTERVRVIGIDTPELRRRECYAQQASSKMQSLVQSKSVVLEADSSQADRDRYGRLLRHVKLTDGRLVAELLIRGGYGREYTYDNAYRYQDRYVAAERAAEGAGKGIWSSGCLDAGTTPVPAPAAKPNGSSGSTGNGSAKGSGGSGGPGAPATGCTIKGNISSKGEKIYHMPGGRSYDATVITLSKGERWFCSAAEAESAGWRAARG